MTNNYRLESKWDQAELWLAFKYGVCVNRFDLPDGEDAKEIIAKWLTSRG